MKKHEVFLSLIVIGIVTSLFFMQGYQSAKETNNFNETIFVEKTTGCFAIPPFAESAWDFSKCEPKESVD